MTRYVQSTQLKLVFSVKALVLVLLNLIWGSLPCSSELRPEIGAQALGMGGAWLGQAEGPSAMFWNPSGLGRLETGDLFYDFSQGAFAVALPASRLGVVGLGFLDLNGSDHFLVDSPQNPIGKFEVGYNQWLFSYARPIGRRLLFGGNINSSRTAHEGSRWRVGYDLGMSADLGSDVWGAARIMDIGGTRIETEDGTLLREFSQQIGVGLTWHHFEWLKVNSDLDAAQWRLRLGSELGPHWLRLRVGVFADLDQPRDPFQWSSGLSFQYKHLECSYAYVEAEERHHHLSLIWRFTGHTTTPIAPRPTSLEIPRLETKPATCREIQPSGRKMLRPTPVRPLQTPQQSVSKPSNVAPQRPETLIRLEPIPELNEISPRRRAEPPRNLSEKLAQQYRVELEMILALIRAESGFDPRAISSVGAVGLAQLMPDTARSLGLKVPTYKNAKNPTQDARKDERFHPRKNLTAGLAYLRQLLDTYDDNYVLAISAYNAGPGRVTEQVPNIRQTEKHIGRVLNYYYQYKNSPEKRHVAVQKLDAILAAQK